MYATMFILIMGCVHVRHPRHTYHKVIGPVFEFYYKGVTYIQVSEVVTVALDQTGLPLKCNKNNY